MSATNEGVGGNKVQPRRKINRIIKEGDTVVIITNNERSKSSVEQNLKPSKKIKLFKKNFLSASDIIGQQYDSYFEFNAQLGKFVALDENPEPEPTYSGECVPRLHWL